MVYNFKTKEDVIFHKNEFLDKYGITNDQLILLSSEIVKGNSKALAIEEWYRNIENLTQLMISKTEANEDYIDLEFSNIGDIPFTFEEMLQPISLTFEEYKAKKIKDNWELVNDFQKKRLTTTKEEIDSLPLATLNIPELPWGLDVIMAEIDG